MMTTKLTATEICCRRDRAGASYLDAPRCEAKALFHTFPTLHRVGVKRKIARRRCLFHGFHGFHTYPEGCVRSARPHTLALASRASLHTPLSVGVKSVKSVKLGDGGGVFSGGWCEMGCEFHTFTPEEVAA